MIDKEYNLQVKECQEKFLRRSAWEGFINRDTIPWDWFATLTFKDFKSQYSAQRHFARWTRLINRKQFGSRSKYEDISIPWVAGYEKQSRGAIHIHALIGNVDQLMRNHWAKVWWENTGGYASILPAQIKGATHYLSKYILKDGDIDIELRNNTGQRLTLDDPEGYPKAEKGSQEVLPGFLLPLEAN